MADCGWRMADVSVVRLLLVLNRGYAGLNASHERESVDTDERCVRSAGGGFLELVLESTHDGEAIAFESHVRGHNDLDAAHHREDVDVGHRPTETGFAKVEADAAHECHRPAPCGNRPSALPQHTRHQGEEVFRPTRSGRNGSLGRAGYRCLSQPNGW